MISDRFWQITKQCTGVKVEISRAHLCANIVKKHVFVYIAIALKNVRWPHVFIAYYKSIWIENNVSSIIISIITIWRHHIVIWNQKSGINFFKVLFLTFICSYLCCLSSILSQIQICCTLNICLLSPSHGFEIWWRHHTLNCD